MKYQIKEKRIARVLSEEHRPLGEGGEIKQMSDSDVEMFIIENTPEPTWQEKRIEAYGSWQEQLNMMTDGTWEAHIAQVKLDIPKENS